MIFINTWNGLPGALIKWFLQSVSSSGLLEMMKTATDRSATAKCIVAMYDGEKLITGTGEISGRLSLEVRGNNGFGWDMIFIPDGHEETFAELGEDYKNTISHRKKAFTDFKSKLK